MASDANNGGGGAGGGCCDDDSHDHYDHNHGAAPSPNLFTREPPFAGTAAREAAVHAAAAAEAGGGHHRYDREGAAAADDDATILDVVPAPSIADVDACRYAAWHGYGSLSEHTFKSVTIPLPSDFVAYLLADGLSLAADSEALPARVAPARPCSLREVYSRTNEDHTHLKRQYCVVARRQALTCPGDYSRVASFEIN